MSSDDSESNKEELDPIVIDNGSYEVKVGFGGEDGRIVAFPAVVGHPKRADFLIGFIKDVYVGDEAHSKRGMLNLKHPIQHGVVDDWDAMEKIWDHAFRNELRVEPSEHEVLLTDSQFNASSREKLTEIMFETFNIRGLYIALQALLAWYYASNTCQSTGRTTNYPFSASSSGVVVDIGYGVTNVVPINNGEVVSHVIERLDIGGKDITEHLIRMLNSRGYSYSTEAEKEIVNDMKERFCHVALDFDQELKAFETGEKREKFYELPEGTLLFIGNEQVRAPEILLRPSTVGLVGDGLADLIHSSIINCASSDIQIDEMASNILLSGGSSKFDYLADRLQKDLIAFPDFNTVKVRSPSCRYGTFKGGAAYTTEVTSHRKWITKDEYDEYGPAIVLSKCQKFLLD